MVGNIKLVTTGFPYIPADLDFIGYMASTYVPADIYKRYLDIFEESNIFISGTEVHGIQAKVEYDNGCKKNQKDPEEFKNEFHKVYEKQFNSLKIEFDYYSRIDSKDNKELTYKALKNLKDKGLIIEKDTCVYKCEDCGNYLPQRFRKLKSTKGSFDYLKTREVGEEEIYCGFCGSENIEVKNKRHWFLDIPSSDSYKRIIDQQKQSSVKKALRFKCNYLEPWDITRENCWGYELPFDSDKQLYIWFPSLVADISLLPRENQQKILNNEGVDIYYFIGKNITFQHGIILPIIYDALGIENYNVYISSRGFMDEKNSDERLISLNKALKKYNPDYLRFYICYKVPDNMQDFSLKEDEMKQIINGILCRRVGTLFTRIYKVLEDEGVEKVPSKKPHTDLLASYIQAIKNSVDNMRVNQTLKNILKYVNSSHKMIHSDRLNKNLSEKEVAFLARTCANTLTLLKPIIPEKIENYNIFDSWNISSLSNTENIENKELTYNYKKWKKI